MFGLVSMHTENYFPLSIITWENNKVLYAKKHGYAIFFTNESLGANAPNYNMGGAGYGWTKIRLIDQIFRERPDLEWLWWTGSDTLITNTDIKIEHKINNNYHFIISVSFNNIDADSFLVRNSPEGRGIIKRMLSLEEQFSKYYDSEQRAFGFLFGTPGYHPEVFSWNSEIPNKEYKDIVKIVNQTYMNSYDYSVYHEHHPQSRNKTDVLGFNGEWKGGDWLIHFPGVSLDEKIELAKQYYAKVI